MRILPLVAVATLLAACESAPEAPIVEVGPPPPYTAEQIRAAHPDGTVIRMRVETEGQATFVTFTRFTDGDAEQVSIASGGEPPGGGEPPHMAETRSKWTELRDHARFPPERTTRQRATCSIETGEHDCWLYTVRNGDGPDAAVNRLWFALDKPGPPVLMTASRGERQVSRMEMIEYRPGG